MPCWPHLKTSPRSRPERASPPGSREKSPQEPPGEPLARLENLSGEHPSQYEGVSGEVGEPNPKLTSPGKRHRVHLTSPGGHIVTGRTSPGAFDLTGSKLHHREDLTGCIPPHRESPSPTTISFIFIFSPPPSPGGKKNLENVKIAKIPKKNLKKFSSPTRQITHPPHRESSLALLAPGFAGGGRHHCRGTYDLHLYSALSLVPRRGRSPPTPPMPHPRDLTALVLEA